MPLRIGMDDVWGLLTRSLRMEYGNRVGRDCHMFFVVTSDTVHELVVATSDEDFAQLEKYVDRLIAERKVAEPSSVAQTAQVLAAAKNAILREVNHHVNPDGDYQKVVDALKKMELALRAVPEGAPLRKELAGVVSAVKRLGEIA